MLKNYEIPAKNCDLCPRLAGFRCQNQQQYPDYFNGAVPSFGDVSAELLIVGLAPGLKGANATGRPFTGDYAGEVLYPALLKAGLATGSYTGLESRGDAGTFEKAGDLQLHRVRVTNAVRCVPPENKPTPQEIKTCNDFLKAEIAAMPHLKVILTLGLVSHQAVCKALGMRVGAYKFEHGAVHRIENQESRIKNSEKIQIPDSRFQILNSYHTSRYNINTGRLTQAMFDTVIEKAKGLLA